MVVLYYYYYTRPGAIVLELSTRVLLFPFVFMKTSPPINPPANCQPSTANLKLSTANRQPADHLALAACPRLSAVLLCLLL